MRQSENECENWNTPVTITEIQERLGMSQRFTLDRSSFEQVLCATSLIQQLNRQVRNGSRPRPGCPQPLSDLVEASAFSRHYEHQADQYGLEVTHGLTPDFGVLPTLLEEALYQRATKK